MLKLQKAGGIAFLFEAVAYVAGIVIMATLLNPGSTTDWSYAQKLAFVLEGKALFHTWNLFVYLAFSIALVVLAMALHERLKDRAGALMQIATPFGLIWAGLVVASGMVATVGLETVAAVHGRDALQATTIWLALGVIQEGLGGGVELVGGVWVLLISVAARQLPIYPKGLVYLGMGVGLVGVLTVIPPLKDLAMVFGISQIVWFVWNGVFMLRRID